MFHTIIELDYVNNMLKSSPIIMLALYWHYTALFLMSVVLKLMQLYLTQASKNYTP